MAARSSAKGKGAKASKTAKVGKTAKATKRSRPAKKPVKKPVKKTAVAKAAKEASQVAPTEAPQVAPTDAPAAEVPILQSWTPLGQCLDYQLGQVAFQQRGAQAFTTNEVPNLINQGGMSAYRAAEVLFTNCAEMDAAGTLEEEICCLEIAMGLGLASLQMLDRFQHICAEAGNDWYERLTWYATDATPKMITDARDNGVFERHSQRVVLGRVDAMLPNTLQRLDTGEVIDLTGKIRAIFQSYLLSLLPSNLLRMAELADEEGVIERRFGIVMARTVLRHPGELSKFTDMSVEQLREVLASGDFGAAMGIVHLYPLFDLDLTLAEITPDQYQGFEEVVRIAENITAQSADNDLQPGQGRQTWVLHSSAASVSICKMLDTLAPGGFVLFRDYGPASADAANRSHLYQHYGAATATGLNHFAFDTMYALPKDQGGCAATASIPTDEGESMIKNRFLARDDIPQTRARYLERFAQKDFHDLGGRIEKARNVKAGVEPSMSEYREALRIEKDNWALLTEAGEVALRQFKQVPLASMFARESLRINPWYNPVAWNVIGDARWHDGDVAGAQDAYEKAVKNNPEHWRGWFNLYLLHRQRGNYARALECASKALANDANAEERTRIQGAVQDAAGLLAVQQQTAVRLRKSRQAGSPR